MMNENEEKLYEMAENELANEPRRRLVGQVPSLLLRGREPGERPIRSTASEGNAGRNPGAANPRGGSKGRKAQLCDQGSEGPLCFETPKQVPPLEEQLFVAINNFTINCN